MTTTTAPPGFIATLLRRLMPEVEVSLRGALCAPWNLDTSGSGRMTFHITDKSTTWLHLPERAPQAIPPGHIVVLPWDSAHVLTHLPDAEPRFGITTASTDTRRAADIALVCGFIDIDASSRRLLHGALPEVLVVPATNAPLGELTRLLFSEAARNTANDDPVLLRLAETLLMYVLRTALERHAPQAHGLGAALADPRLSPALEAMLQAPERHWTVAELAKRAHLSRSGFAQCFHEVVGRGPIDVLTEWRMQQARRLLKTAGACVPDVAERCGYRSEAAFARAFKRVMGYGPGEARRRQGASVR